MTCANTLLLLIQTATQECAVTSLVSMRSVPVRAVSRSVIHVVLRSIPYHNQRVCCLTFCKQRVLVQSRNLAGTTLPHNKLYVAKVTVYQHVGFADIHFLVLTIATYSSCDVTSQQTSSMLFPHHSSRHILVHRRIFHPSRPIGSSFNIMLLRSKISIVVFPCTSSTRIPLCFLFDVVIWSRFWALSGTDSLMRPWFRNACCFRMFLSFPPRHRTESLKTYPFLGELSINSVFQQKYFLQRPLVLSTFSSSSWVS